MTEMDELLANPVSRRTFLARMTAAGLGAAAVALLAGCGGSTGSTLKNGGGTGTTFFDPNNFPGIPGSSENVVVLNYALTLETLEADLYRQALNIAAGKPAATPAPANSDYSSYTQTVGNGTLSAQNAAIGFLYLQQYAGVEAAHRDFLRTALGSAAVSANAKGYTTGLAAGADMGTILSLIRTVEETGVRAYQGAAPFLTDNTLIQTAVSIYSTEARHSAAMDYILSTSTNPAADIGPRAVYGGTHPPLTTQVTGVTIAENTFDYQLTPAAVLNAVKPFIL